MTFPSADTPRALYISFSRIGHWLHSFLIRAPSKSSKPLNRSSRLTLPRASDSVVRLPTMRGDFLDARLAVLLRQLVEVVGKVLDQLVAEAKAHPDAGQQREQLPGQAQCR